MYRKALFSLACSLLIAATALAATKIVKLKDGRELTGEVVKTEDGKIIVKTKYGESAPINPEDIESMEDVVTPEEEYAQKLKEIDPKSAEDHYKLGKWAFEKGLLEIAEKELKEALEIDPDHERAALMLRRVQAKMEEEGQDENNSTKPEDGEETTNSSTGSAVVKPEYLISQEDINRIRYFELRQSDRVSVEFKNDAVERYIEIMQGTGDFKEKDFDRKFRSWSKLQKVKYIRKNLDDDSMDIIDDIVITKDPQFMMDFRTQIWPILTNGCAALTCHGGEKVNGGLKIFNVSAKDVKVDYTNYVLLWGCVKHGEGGGYHRVIDKNSPDLSLLLQYGLPPENAKYKHPVKIKAMYTSTRDRKYVRVMDWIKSLDGPPMPDYHLVYKAPFGMQVQGDIIDIGLDEPTTKPKDGSEEDSGEETEMKD